MKNIYKVFISDWKRISKNVVAVVVVMGLIILPSLYAWFNILSNWDPYGEESTSRIKVAVASDDKGIVMDSLQFNMGDTIIEALESNNTIGWVFTDSTKDAIDGLRWRLLCGACNAGRFFKENGKFSYRQCYAP